MIKIENLNVAKDSMEVVYEDAIGRVELGLFSISLGLEIINSYQAEMSERAQQRIAESVARVQAGQRVAGQSYAGVIVY